MKLQCYLNNGFRRNIEAYKTGAYLSEQKMTEYDFYSQHQNHSLNFSTIQVRKRVHVSPSVKLYYVKQRNQYAIRYPLSLSHYTPQRARKKSQSKLKKKLIRPKPTRNQLWETISLPQIVSKILEDHHRLIAVNKPTKNEHMNKQMPLYLSSPKENYSIFIFILYIVILIKVFCFYLRNWFEKLLKCFLVVQWIYSSIKNLIP